jgi:hypothetical protein
MDSIFINISDYLKAILCEIIYDMRIIMTLVQGEESCFNRE